MLPQEVIQKNIQIETAARAVVRELTPIVRHIRFEIAPDWTGELAVFFRVLLSDEASRSENLSETTNAVEWRMAEKLPPPELELCTYFYFRSESEQAALQAADWAAA